MTYFRGYFISTLDIFTELPSPLVRVVFVVPGRPPAATTSEDDALPLPSLDGKPGKPRGALPSFKPQKQNLGATAGRTSFAKGMPVRCGGVLC